MRLIRKMTAEDVKAVSILEAENFSMPWKEADFKQALEDESMRYLVAEENGVVIGVCGVRNIIGEGEISNVSVQRGYRGRNIAFDMLTELLEQGERSGIRAYTLEVRSKNASAVALYRKLGFVTEGVRKNFYEKPVEDALIMWKR